LPTPIRQGWWFMTREAGVRDIPRRPEIRLPNWKITDSERNTGRSVVPIAWGKTICGTGNFCLAGAWPRRNS